MKTAYETLGVPPTAGETEIRNRYLALVREFPPDRAPERFAEIRAAFDELRNPVARLERKLFFLPTTDTLQDLEQELVSRLKTAAFPTSVLLSLADAT
jgi:curved DNA-binding protein CbpA